MPRHPNSGRRGRSNSMDSVCSYDSRRGGRRGRSPRGQRPIPSRHLNPGRSEPRPAVRNKYAPSLTTPTNRNMSGPYFPPQPSMVAHQAAPFGSHQLVTYQQQQQQQQQQQAYQPPAHHQLFTQQQMLTMQAQPAGVVAQGLSVSPLHAHGGGVDPMHMGMGHGGVVHGTIGLAPAAAHHQQQQQLLHQHQQSVVHPAHLQPVGVAPSPIAAQMPQSAPPTTFIGVSAATPVPDPSGMNAADLYRALCSSNDEVLPAGWEKINYNGQIIFLDHLNREAHDEHPYKIWSRAFASAPNAAESAAAQP